MPKAKLKLVLKKGGKGTKVAKIPLKVESGSGRKGGYLDRTLTVGVPIDGKGNGKRPKKSS